MTAPTQSSSVSIDDVESQLTPEPAGSDLNAIKLDGQGVPEDLRGKTVAELVQIQRNLETSLKLSEQGRMLAQQAADAKVVLAAPVVQEEPDLDDEQLADLHASEPVKAIRYMQRQAERNAQRNLEARLGPMVTGTTSAVESAARTRYPTEFAALGTEISKVIETLPDRSVLTNPTAWDQLIAYVRGQAGNFEKMVALHTQRRAPAAQAAQVAESGLSLAPSAGVPATIGDASDLDDYTKEIARNLNMSPQDYVKWRKIT